MGDSFLSAGIGSRKLSKKRKAKCLDSVLRPVLEHLEMRRMLALSYDPAVGPALLSAGLSNTLSGTVSPAVTSAPNAPTNLKTTGVGKDWATISWTKASGLGSTTNDYYIAYGSTTSATTGFRKLENIPSSDATARLGYDPDHTYDYRLEQSTHYWVYLKSHNSWGESTAKSNTIEFTTFPPPNPTSLQVTNVTTSTVTVSWIDNSANESGFDIQISSDGTNFVSWTTCGANSAAFTGGGLQPYTTYWLRVRATSSVADSTWSNVTAFTTLDHVAAPTNLTATAASASHINLTWTDNSNNETGFIVHRRTAVSDWVEIGRPNSSNFSDTELSANTTYTYRVLAYNSNVASSPSNEASATTRLPTPSNLTATAASSSQITVGWNSVASVTGYIVQRKTGTGDWTEVGRPAAPNFSDTGLSANTTYSYRVIAFNSSVQSDPSTAASATTRLPTPLNLTASVASASQIALAWNAVANATGYIVQRKTGAGDWTELGRPTAPNFSNTGLIANTTYSYRVIAFNSNVQSDPSNEASATTPQQQVAIVAPTNLTAAAVSASQINLAWTDNSNNETGFNIERKTGSGGTWALIATTAAGATSYQNTGLTANTFFYRVIATNGAVNSAPSNEASATTQQVAIVAPTNLTATAASASQINLAWTDNSSNETGFKIERKTGSGAWAEIATVGANVRAYSNTGLAGNTTYTYRIVAYNSNTTSTFSNDAFAATTGVAVAAPTSLAASVVSTSQINLVWRDISSNETAFGIERKTGIGGAWAQVAQVGAGVTSYQNTGLLANIPYYYRVFAINGDSRSAPSNEASATTAEAQTGAPVKDIIAGLGSGEPQYLTAMNGLVYFSAVDRDHGRELWCSDGTEEGTYLVLDGIPGAAGLQPQQLVAAGDKLYFVSATGNTAYDGLWVSDGTEGGTRRIVTAPASAVTAELTPMNGGVFFVANSTEYGRELFFTDGVEWRLVADINTAGSSGPQSLTVLDANGVAAGGEVLYFHADHGPYGRELWRSDGTQAGTWMVQNINNNANAKSGNGLQDGSTILAVGNKLFFLAYQSSTGIELWTSDGTTGGTRIVKELNQGTGDGFLPLVTGSKLYLTGVGVGNSMVFGSRDSTGTYRLWATDGSTLTQLSSSIGLATDGRVSMVYGSGGVYFARPKSGGGLDLWFTDGTVGGTVASGASWPELAIGGFGIARIEGGGVCYFPDTQKLNWVDGTATSQTIGTAKLAGLPSSAYQGSAAIAFGQLFYVNEATGTGKELWALPLPGATQGFAVRTRQFGTGGNAGDYTLRAAGVSFDDSVTVKITDARGVSRSAKAYWQQSDRELYATFDLGGLTAGKYNVVFTKGSETVTVAQSLTVVAAPATNLVMPHVIAPSAIRRGVAFSFTVEWQNNSINDALAPLLTVGCTVPFGLSAGDYSLGTRYTFLATNTQGGPAGILRPGQRGTITFWAYSDREAGDYTVFVDREFKDLSAAFDWNALRRSLIPAGMTSAEFEPIFQRLKSQIGPTAGDYLAMLARNASQLENGSASRLSELHEIEVRRAWAAVTPSISGSIGSPSLVGQVIYAVDVDTQEAFVSPILADGSFAIVGLPSGSYELVVPGYDLTTSMGQLFAVDDTQSVTGLDVTATAFDVSVRLQELGLDAETASELEIYLRSILGITHPVTSSAMAESFVPSSADLADLVFSRDDELADAVNSHVYSEELVEYSRNLLTDLIIAWTGLSLFTAARHMTYFVGGMGGALPDYLPGSTVSRTAQNSTSVRCSHREAAGIIEPQVKAFIEAAIRDGKELPSTLTFEEMGISILKAPDFSIPATWHNIVSLKANLFLAFGGMHPAMSSGSVVSVEHWSDGDRINYRATIQYEWRDVYSFWDDKGKSRWDNAAYYLEFVDRSAKAFDTAIVIEEVIEGKTDTPGEPDDDIDIERPVSVDPNDILGPAGVGAGRHIPLDNVMPYTIRFENDAQLGTAPAGVVTITQTLDSDLDWDTFRLGDVGFGDVVITVPSGTAYFQTRYDATATLGVFVDIEATFDGSTGKAIWRFTAIDPETGELPLDPFMGFLPPNVDSPEGEGWVTYSVRPKTSLVTGARIDATASIVFDVNDPIAAPPIFNTIDAGSPSSQVLALAQTQGSENFLVSWTGADDSEGSGIATYDIYVSDDGGNWKRWLDDVAVTSATFDGQNGHTYRFYSVAVDWVGHQEIQTAAADTTTNVNLNSAPWVIDGSAGNDVIVLDKVGTDYRLTHNGQVTTREAALVTSITFNGLAGDDTITVSGDVPALIYGGDGNDTITGGSGNDTVYGNLGDDVIDGGAGDDSIMAGLGADAINGNMGNDRIWGGDQSDTIRGDDGDDYIEGKGKADLLHGDAGKDTVHGMAGNDSVYGNFGDDMLYGEGGEDEIMGGLGADSIDGDTENDRIWGGDHSDTISGGDGDDYIEGKGKADTVYGGNGNDTLLGQAGADVIYGDAGDDRLDVGPASVFRDTVVGGEGHDLALYDDDDVISEVEGLLA